MDRFGVCSDADSAPVRLGEKGAEPKGKALDLLVNLCSYPQLWSRALGSDKRYRISGPSD